MGERTVVIGNLDAIGYGFSSFFSIWQVCILQISPFFIAYVIGLFFAGSQKSNAGRQHVSQEREPELEKKTRANNKIMDVRESKSMQRALGGRVVLPALSFALGFAVIYALLTMTGLPIGRVLVYNLGTFEFIAGGYILLVSLLLVFSGRFAVIATLLRPLILAAASLGLGISFALIYSPCITPALSKILGMAFRPETAVRGGTLAFFYALGICLALTVTATALVYLLARIGILRRHPAVVRNAGGGVLAILAAFNLSGTMVYYKAFILGFLVE